MRPINIVCIGGGHGLGRLLKSIAMNPNYKVTAIVTTTDNGGSTGMLRRHHGTIAWGDIRYCMNQLASNTSLESLLFDHRFTNCGELSNHAMGNLMLHAADQLCVRPTDTVQMMRRLLAIETQILPMSDTSSHLTAMSEEGDILYGELEIERSSCPLDYQSLGLTNEAKPTAEVLEAIRLSDLIIIAPGSFVTSILPPFLMPEIVTAVNESSSPFLMFANLSAEQNSHFSQFADKLDYLKYLKLRGINEIFWPRNRRSPQGLNENLVTYPFSDGSSRQHCSRELYSAIDNFIRQQTRAIA